MSQNQLSTPFGDVTGFVLAGGKSSRMGRDKALMLIHDQTFLERTLATMSEVCAECYVVGPSRKYGTFGPVVEDHIKGCGPLGGIHAALRATANDLNLIVAVDTPTISPNLLKYLIHRARPSSALVTVPQSGRYLQPLCAVYRRRFAERAEQAIRSRRFKIDELFLSEITNLISEAELRSAGVAATFPNVNTPDDVKQLLASLRQR